MKYLSIGDPNGEIVFLASLLGDRMEAAKFFRCQKVASTHGCERWERFFEKVARLPIHPEERCMVMRLPLC